MVIGECGGGKVYELKLLLVTVLAKQDTQGKKTR